MALVNMVTTEPMQFSVLHAADNYSSTTYWSRLCLTANPLFLLFLPLLLSTICILQTPQSFFLLCVFTLRDYSCSPSSRVSPHSTLTLLYHCQEPHRLSPQICASPLDFLVNTLQCFLSSQEKHSPWSGVSPILILP